MASARCMPGKSLPLDVATKNVTVPDVCWAADLALAEVLLWLGENIKK